MSDSFTVRVQNMSGRACAACAQAALASVNGIDDVAVSLADESAHFTAGSAKALKDAFTALDKAGFPGALREDENAARREEKENDVASLRRATLIAAGLTLPVVILATGSHTSPTVHHAILTSIGTETSWQLQSVLTTALFIGPGLRFFRRGIPTLLRGAPDITSLVALGTGAAYAYSVFVLAAPELLPEQLHGVYFESASVVIVLTLLGFWMEARMRSRAGALIERFISPSPKLVCIELDDEWVERPLADLASDQVFMVRAGERVAADGVVIRGHNDVDQSMFTGPQMPIAKSVGDSVISGTMNLNETLHCRAASTRRDSESAEIIDLVKTAKSTRLPIQLLVDRIILRFLPAILTVAVLAMLVWVLVGPEPKLAFMFVVGLSVLIVACPFAMGLASSTSIMIGADRAAKLGAVFRTCAALQHLQGATLIAFGDSGILTEGRPTLVKATFAAGHDRSDALVLIAAVAVASQHPISTAILEAAKGLTARNATQIKVVLGCGVSGHVDGAQIHVGKYDWLTKLGANLSVFDADRIAAEAMGQIVLFASLNGSPLAMLTIADTVKSGVKAAVEALQARGLRVAMISSNGQAAVDHFDKELGIDVLIADVLPEEKVAALDSLRFDGEVVAFIGNSMEDAPALAHADIGIALSTSSDIAIDAADIVLTADDLGGVAVAVSASLQTVRNIRQNLVWASGFNVALIPIAAGLLYPIFGILLSPSLAMGAIGLSSLFVITNALRLRKMNI